MIRLYSYWRSSAAYRVRIALHLKAIAYECVPVNLVKDGGQQFAPDYLALNPQARVPLLVDGEFRIGQSMAILDYLEGLAPRPSLLPDEPRLRARILAFCHAIAADIHPLHNTGPLRYLVERLEVSEERRDEWIRHWIERGLAALEQERSGRPDTPYVFGDAPTWADCLLVPQMYAAERFKCDARRFPLLQAIARRLRELPPFAAAHPDRQPDAPKA